MGIIIGQEQGRLTYCLLSDCMATIPPLLHHIPVKNLNKNSKLTNSRQSKVSIALRSDFNITKEILAILRGLNMESSMMWWILLSSLIFRVFCTSCAWRSRQVVELVSGNPRRDVRSWPACWCRHWLLWRQRCCGSALRQFSLDSLIFTKHRTTYTDANRELKAAHSPLINWYYAVILKGYG